MAKMDPLEQFAPAELLWKGRKCILGMPISFTAYQVDRDRLTCKKGFFKTEVDELLLYRVLDIKLSRTLGQKLLGVGTITLYCADRTHNIFKLENVQRPESIRVFLSKLVEYERTSKGLVGKEIYGVSGAPMAEGVPIPPPPYVDIDGDGIPD